MADDWESALRKLTRVIPSEGIKTTVLDAMRSDLADRAAALIMASAADTMLQGAIVYILGLNRQHQINAFFYSDGPFATFDRRIVGASNLNVVGPRTTTNLKVIKNVRNVFAHALSNVSFSSDQIIKACYKIKLSDTSQFFVDQEEERKIRFIFGFACDEIFRTMLEDIEHKWIFGHLPRQILPDTPMLP